VRATTANGGQRRLLSWSFAILRAYITYKAEERGIRVEGVDPLSWLVTSSVVDSCGQSRGHNPGTQGFCAL